jgi:predicted Na+-dependent transporter
VKPRGIGRGRVVVAIGALLTAIGCFLPWWSVGGTVTELHTGNAFDSILGMLVFASALAMVAVMVIPYASRDRESRLDSFSVYLLLFVIGAAAFATRMYQISLPNFAGLGLPQSIPGAWITGAGLVVVLFGLFELFSDDRRRER